MAYLIISLCLFPLAVGGYWAYGNKVRDMISRKIFCFQFLVENPNPNHVISMMITFVRSSPMSDTYKRWNSKRISSTQQTQHLKVCEGIHLSADSRKLLVLIPNLFYAGF